MGLIKFYMGTGQLGESDTLHSTMFPSLLSLVKSSASQDAREGMDTASSLYEPYTC